MAKSTQFVDVRPVFVSGASIKLRESFKKISNERIKCFEGIEYAVNENAKAWSAEVRIPYYLLAEDQPDGNNVKANRAQNQPDTDRKQCLVNIVAAEADKGRECQHHQRKFFGRAEYQGDVCQRWRKKSKQ